MSEEIERVRSEMPYYVYQWTHKDHSIDILMTEIDRLNDIIKTAYKFYQEDMQTCVGYMLCPEDFTEKPDCEIE